MVQNVAPEHFITHQVPVELAAKYPSEQNGGGGVVVVVGGGEGEEGRMDFQSIPESESIAGSMSPITGLPRSTEPLVFPSDKPY